MRAIIGAGLMAVLAVAAAPADDKAEKIDGKKLLGRWEPHKSANPLPKGESVVMEFAKDGKLVVSVSSGGGKAFSANGTYKLDGNKLALTYGEGDKKDTDTATVTKLTDEVLELKSEKGEVDEFKRVKEKGKR